MRIKNSEFGLLSSRRTDRATSLSNTPFLTS